MKKSQLKKLIKEEISKSLNEQVYDYEFVDESYDEIDGGLLSVDYKFSTPKNPYRVYFYSGEYNPEDKAFDATFGIERGSQYGTNTDEYTGENDVRNVLQTVSAIINTFLEDYKDEVDKVYISGTDDKRKRVYRSLLPKYLDEKHKSKIVIKEDEKISIKTSY